MSNAKKILKFIYDFLEIYIPCIAFICLFITYVILIVMRYVLKMSIGWMAEFNTMMFLVMVVFNSSYGSRSNEHIVFSIVYDTVSPKIQLIMRTIVNVTSCIVYCIILPNAYKGVMFMAVKKSSLLKVPYSILYFPFLIYLGLTIIHHLTGLILDIQMVRGEEGVK